MARRAADGSRIAEAPTCDPALHAQHLELELLCVVFTQLVVPEPREELAAAIHRAGQDVFQQDSMKTPT